MLPKLIENLQSVTTPFTNDMLTVAGELLNHTDPELNEDSSTPR
jgi:hypothetical protein